MTGEALPETPCRAFGLDRYVQVTDRGRIQVLDEQHLITNLTVDQLVSGPSG